jgi:hypothetical protein
MRLLRHSTRRHLDCQSHTAHCAQTCSADPFHWTARKHRETHHHQSGQISATVAQTNSGRAYRISRLRLEACSRAPPDNQRSRKSCCPSSAQFLRHRAAYAQ